MQQNDSFAQTLESERAQKTEGRAGDERRAGAQQEVKLPSKWAVMAILAIGIFMATLDSSIVNISLPTIATYFQVPLNGAIEWVIIAYLIVIAGVLLTIGRLADMVGRKALWVAGLVIFTLGSAICGAAPALLVLIIARAFQGLGGALVMSVSTDRSTWYAAL